MNWLRRNTYGLVAFLLLVVAADWTVVARTAWFPSMVGLSLSVGMGLVALRSIGADIDDAGAPVEEVRSAPPTHEPPTWVTGTRLGATR